MIEFFIGAVNQLAMKRAWAYMMGVQTVMSKVWKKYRTHYMDHCFQEMRKRSVARIKAMFKLSMKRWFAQYAEWDELENGGTQWRDINRLIFPTREKRRIKQ